AFLTDAIDVRRFSNHQPLMIDARLHPADVIPHDEEDVRLLLLLRGHLRGCRDHCSSARKQTKPGPSSHFHDNLLRFQDLSNRRGTLSNDAAKSQVTCGRVDVLRMAGRRTVPPAVIGRTQMRAPLDDLAGYFRARLARIVAVLLTCAARVLR